MASVGQVPPPVRQRPPRSFAGPIVLIAVGVVFLLETMGVLHWQHLGRLFAHYWPVLLILWGIIKLLEYFQAQSAGARPAGMGVGGAFLITMIVVFGLAATQISKLDWQSIHEHFQG